jgi:hypothetical protein
MRVGAALKLAGRDLFDNSWRLVPVNAALGIVLVAVGLAAVAVHAALVLAVLAGPVAVALVHCAVTLVRTGNLAVADAWEGLRMHWRRGLQLGAAGTALVVLAALAVRFYARVAFGWPLAFLTVYIVVLLGIFIVVLTTFAVAEPDKPVRHAAREAAALGAGRPGATLLLGLSLLLVNLAGIVAAVMPFLTLTVAYSFVAVAHFALPRPSKEL